jgi:hypothetical protein
MCHGRPDSSRSSKSKGVLHALFEALECWTALQAGRMCRFWGQDSPAGAYEDKRYEPPLLSGAKQNLEETTTKLIESRR